MCQNKFTVKIGKRLNPLTGVEHDIYEWVSCRKCEECVSIRKSQWCFRAMEETKHDKYSDFVTLTYDDQHLPAQGVMVKHCQLFFKRLRKNMTLWCPEHDQKKEPLRYFLVSEYGSKKARPHYHLILWNCPLNVFQIQACWKMGNVKIGTTTPKSVQYTLKYFAIKDKAPEGKLKNFCLMSKNIGHQWLSDNLFYVKSYVCMPDSGAKIPIPEYYRKKLNYPKKVYYHDYEPDLYDGFSRKFLRSRGLLTRRLFEKKISNVRNYNVLLEDAENYYLYRDEIFHRKYDKINNDNQ